MRHNNHVHESFLVDTLLVNTLGHATGVLIFGIFLYVLLKDGPARRLGGSTKSMLAAGLALAWNLASLVVLGLSDPASKATTLTVGLSFSVLSLLPAVLFDLCLAERSKMLVRSGYLLSAVAIGLHLAELLTKGMDRYHRWGLTLITAGFGALTCIGLAASFLGQSDAKRRSGAPRLVGTMSLFLLAMSFVHLGGEHVQTVWSQELAFHHVGIPLALLVLLQDYRFVLLDAFLRFLANMMLAAIFVSGSVVVWRFGLFSDATDSFSRGLLLVAACLILVAFAILRTWFQALLTRLVFRRPSEAALLQSLKLPIRTEPEYFEAVASVFGSFLGVRAHVAQSLNPDDGARLPFLVSELAEGRAELEDQGIEVVIPLRPVSGGGCWILLGRRSGGRRYLSEDLQALSAATAAAIGQVEQYRDNELRRLVAQAELRALQSQIHPHFLFNALNALYGIIPREAKGARDTVLNLADMFRYFLETHRTMVPLKRNCES